MTLDVQASEIATLCRGNTDQRISGPKFPPGKLERVLRRIVIRWFESCLEFFKKSFKNNNLWLGRKDSNLRMAVPKTAALPLGYAPAGPGVRHSGHGRDAASSRTRPRRKDPFQSERGWPRMKHPGLPRCSQTWGGTGPARAPAPTDPFPLRRAAPGPAGRNRRRCGARSGPRACTPAGRASRRGGRRPR